MPEPSRIGVVYRDRVPALLRGSLRPHPGWQIEYFDEEKILSGPVVLRSDYLAVFCPSSCAPDNWPGLVAHIFPGAEIIEYTKGQTAQAGARARPAGAGRVVELPLSYRQAKQIISNRAARKRSRREIDAAERRIDDLEEFFAALVDLIESAWSVGDRQAAVGPVMEKLRARLRAEECALYKVGDGGSRFERTYSTETLRDVELLEHAANGAIVEKVFRSGAPLINNDCAFELQVPFGQENIRVHSILCFPLQCKGETVGVIEVLNKAGRQGFTAEDRELVETVALPLAVALRNLAMFEASHDLTVTDDLTKLYNYRYLTQFLDEEVKRCLRYDKRVSILFIDIDGFKNVNDTFGHLVGSQTLAEMGQVFRNLLRETDIASRYGGDEFVVVMPETPLSGALLIAERIRRRVVDYVFAGQNLGIRLTVSVGVANCPEHALTAEGLIRKADAAMYRAKQLSRNSIEVAV